MLRSTERCGPLHKPSIDPRQRGTDLESGIGDTVNYYGLRTVRLC